MRMICLVKRRPLSRDLLVQPYGRFFHLSRGLADQGHEVHLLLLNYQREAELCYQQDDIHWHSVNLLPDPTRYYRRVLGLGAEIGVDWVIGFSDTWFGICAQHVAKRLGAYSLIDAYDNYESYMPWCTPLHWLWRRALQRCDYVTAAGPQLLAQMCMQRVDSDECSAVLPMAADPEFTPRPKAEARARLQLPPGTPIVIYTGSMFANRGITTLLEACRLVGRDRPEMQFLFSGRQDRAYELPGNCKHLGYLDDESLKDLYASADLLVAVNTSSTFGAHSYPVKLYEALAMGLPVLASDTAASRYILGEQTAALVPVKNSAALADRILELVNNPGKICASPPGWSLQANQLARILATHSG